MLALCLALATLSPSATLEVLKGCGNVRALSHDGNVQLVTVGRPEIVEHEKDDAAVVTDEGSRVLGIRDRTHGVQVIHPLRGYRYTWRSALSDDGSTVAGACTNDDFNPGRRFESVAYIWRRDRGTEPLKPTGKGWRRLDEVTGISGDGAVVVGVGTIDLSGQGREKQGREAFRWTARGGAQHLGFVDRRYPDSYAESVSRDGTWVAGVSAISPPYPGDTGGTWTRNKAVVWDFAGRMQLLPWTSKPRGEVGLRCVSADGRSLLGYDGDGDLIQTDKGLSRIPDNSGYGPSGLIGNPPVVVGVDAKLKGQGSLWTPKGGWTSKSKIMSWLTSRLAHHPIRLIDIDCYSSDLNAVAGSGKDSKGKQVPWVVRLPAGALRQFIRA